jgi:predicted membrane-bound spermidine synthase
LQTFEAMGNSNTKTGSQTSVSQRVAHEYERWFIGLLIALFLGEFLGYLGIVAPPHELISSLLSGAEFLSSALLGAYLIYLSDGRSRAQFSAVTLLGVGLEVILAFNRPESASSISGTLLHLGTGLGVVAITAQTFALRKPDEGKRREVRRTLYSMLLMPGFIAVSISVLDLTKILHPRVLDASVFMMDTAFSSAPSFSLSRAIQEMPFLRGVLVIVYMHLPAACAAVYALGRRSKKGRQHDDLINVFLWVGVAGFVVYHVVPVVGPASFFRDAFPNRPPAVENIKAIQYLAIPENRNCFPSLHTAWALLIAIYGSRLGRVAGLFSWLFAGLTLLATVGLGLHYVMDLVAALPFLLAIQTWRMKDTKLRSLLVNSLGLFGLWSLAVLFGGALFRDTPILTWFCSIITLAYFVRGQRKLWLFAADDAHFEPHNHKRPSPPMDKIGRGLTAVFFLSGFAALVYQVVFAKALALTFGSMGGASATVLTAYMAGIALGSWIGGKLANEGRDPIRTYVVCEFGIAVWCALTPVLFTWVRALYISIAAGGDPSNPQLVALQLALGLAVLMPPTILMGITLPVLTAHFEGKTESLGASVGRLYGANTLGAAAGALLTGYLLLPSIGTIGSTGLAVAMNLMAALAAMKLSKLTPRPGELQLSPAADVSTVHKNDRLRGWIAVAILTVGGILTLALESTYVHLLAVVAGNSAYAFALMLFCFLLGLGGGAAISRKKLEGGMSPGVGLAICQLGLSVAIIVGLFWWDQVPAYFESFAQYKETRSFEKREFVRFVTCALTMLPVSLFIGAAYPFSMELVGRAWPKHRLLALGRAAAANTLGNIIGALVGGFLLIPLLGSFSTLEAMSGAALCLAGLMAWSLDANDRRKIGLGIVMVLALFPLLPQGFNMTRLASGANVYFHSQSYGEVIDFAESLDGGLTTVSRFDTKNEGRVYTLLTNGKFQGDSSDKREMQAQVGFGLTPMLHTPQRERALVIGFGTGVTARAIHDGGFKALDVVELSGDLLDMAKRYFKKKNGDILARENVHTHVTDGRNYLMLTHNTYDLISIEVSSIWFAGAAALYNDEFYALTKTRLSKAGVLQQWIQLHRLSPANLVSIMATLRNHFQGVWLYVVGGQGMLIGCDHDCTPTPETLNAMDTSAQIKPLLSLYQNGTKDLLRSRLFKPAELDRFLVGMRSAGLDATTLISTDNNHLLEYATPRANVRKYGASLKENLRLLRHFQTPVTQ